MSGRRKTALFLVLCLTLTLVWNNGFQIKAAETGATTETVYIDGVGYNVTYNLNGEYQISVIGNEAVHSTIEFGANGTAEVMIHNNKDIENYTLDIPELNAEDVDIDVYSNGEKVTEFNDVDEIVEDEYVGQAATATVSVTVISLTTLLEIIVTVAATAVIAAATCEALSVAYEAIKENTKKQGDYFRAWLKGGDVFIRSDDPITENAAASRVAGGLSVYTFTSTKASYVCYLTGLGVTAKEIDSKANRKKGCIYYYHYHTANRNGAHSWFGRPYYQD